jgi:hypothetical protein
VAKLMRMTLIVGLAVIGRPIAATGQYSWSDASVTVGLGSGFGFGVSYTSLDPWYDPPYVDPCWDYDYYELYYACPIVYTSATSSHHYRRPVYYEPYRYYGYPSYNRFSVRIGLNFGHGYPSTFYGHSGHGPHYNGFGYPSHWYSYGYGYGYGYRNYDGYRNDGGYGYSQRGVVRYGGSRRSAVMARPAAVYRSSPVVRSSARYKESPRPGAQRAAVARSETAGIRTTERSAAAQRTGASNPKRSVALRRPARGSEAADRRAPRVRPSKSATQRTRGARSATARTGSPTRLSPPDRKVAIRPSNRARSGAVSSPRRETTERRTAQRSGTERNDLARGAARTRPTTASTPEKAAPRPRSQSLSGAAARSATRRQHAPVARSAPRTRPRASNPAQARTASPSRSRAMQPSAQRTAPRAAPRPRAARSSAPRASGQAPRRSSAGASRGSAGAGASAAVRGRSTRRSGR